MAGPGRKEEVYFELRRRIMSGELVPGTQLSPPDLAERYGVSRTPVRDALHALAQEGLVVVEPRRGYFVSRITVRDVEDIFENLPTGSRGQTHEGHVGRGAENHHLSERFVVTLENIFL